jgi:methylase of polypeptide subunit release factors
MIPSNIAHPDALADLGRFLLLDQDYRFTTVTQATHGASTAAGKCLGARFARRVRLEPAVPRGLLPDAMQQHLLEAGLIEDAGSGRTAGWRALVRASTVGRQLYFHSAWPTSDEDAVFFGPDTYRYRWRACSARSELLQRPVVRAVDIGCGSGAGAIELALRRPQATDLRRRHQPGGAGLHRINAELNGSANVVPCRSDLLDGVDGRFDLVMSNPPYILDEDELPYRHGGGEHGAELSIRIVRAGLERLLPGGSLLLYTGVAIVDGEDRFLAAVRPLLEASCSDWRYEELDPDIFGSQLECDGYEDVERLAAVWLHAVKRG